MKTVPLIVTTLIAGVSLCAFPLPAANAAEHAPNPISPGFVPETGQINPGIPRVLDSHAQAAAVEVEKKIPTVKEAFAAFHGPVVKDPAIGNMPSTPVQAQSANQAQSVNAIGGPMAPGASSSGVAGGSAGAQAPAGSSTSPGGASAANGEQTTGKASQDSGPATAAPASSEKAPAEWPVGSLGQTAPAKFSQRNDTLDHVPIMGWFALPLSNEDRAHIFSTVMAEQGAPSANADKLSVASQVTTQQALNEMKPLPQSIGIEHIRSLDYLKAKDKVLLVEPATRVVVGVVAK